MVDALSATAVAVFSGIGLYCARTARKTLGTLFPLCRRQPYKFIRRLDGPGVLSCVTAYLPITNRLLTPHAVIFPTGNFGDNRFVIEISRKGSSRRYFKGRQFTEDVDAEGKIALITGASSGIGMQTARELNLRGATVYMLCRDYERAFTARIQLTQLGCDPTRLIIKVVDLANLTSVRDCAREILQELSVVDILVNNAGIMFYPKFELTNDGHETTWQTNYLGHFLLTELLLPLLERSANGRIVNVSSSLHKRADSVDFSIVDDPKHFNRRQPYNRSKLAQVMHARELTRRIRTSNLSGNVIINSMSPGMCKTNLGRYTILSKTPFRQIFMLPMWFFTKTDKDGAQTVLHLCLSRSVESISGKYFAECEEREPSSKALDDNSCNLLYNYSIEAVDLPNSLKYVSSTV